MANFFPCMLLQKHFERAFISKVQAEHYHSKFLEIVNKMHSFEPMLHFQVMDYRTEGGK